MQSVDLEVIAFSEAILKALAYVKGVLNCSQLALFANVKSLELFLQGCGVVYFILIAGIIILGIRSFRFTGIMILKIFSWSFFPPP
jgi:hypothetical protein